VVDSVGDIPASFLASTSGRPKKEISNKRFLKQKLLTVFSDVLVLRLDTYMPLS
jgi:hypothetical protein